MKTTVLPLGKWTSNKIIYMCPVLFTQAFFYKRDTSEDILGKIIFKLCMIHSIFKVKNSGIYNVTHKH